MVSGDRGGEGVDIDRRFADTAGMGSDELISLLVQVIQRPDEPELRRRAAELLDQRGAADEAMALLAPLVNFTGHDEQTALPCLCKTCLPKAAAVTESGGVTFHRSFAVHGSRVLYFWLIDELGEQRAEVKRAVGEALRLRLSRKGKRAAQ